MAQPATDEGERLAAAHRALTRDGSVQFELRPVDPPQPPPPWLQDLGRSLRDFFRALGQNLRWINDLLPDAPLARILIWTLIVLAALALAAIVVERLRGGVWQLPRWRARTAPVSPADDPDTPWTPEAAPARRWLEEAEALAAAGRFAEAAHHLLLRSVEDMARRRPQLVAPAITSRELAAAEALPNAARAPFASIARLVERSLFGGRPVGPDDWHAAREAYRAFAEGRSWQA